MDHPVLEATAGLTVVATILGWLPPLAAAFGIAWYCILIYDRFKRKASVQKDNPGPDQGKGGTES